MSVKVLRAVSGAGKSTFAKKLWLDCQTFGGDGGAKVELPSPPTVHVISTDDFYMVDGVYQFDWRKLGEAHQATQRKFLELVKDPNVVIIVDNTNTSIAEFAWYVVTAQLFGHDTEIITLIADPATAWRRNTHGVPPETVYRMDERLRADTNNIPPYWKHKIVYV